MTGPAILQTPSVRPAHRRAYQLFHRYGALTHSEALECAKAEGWDISPSGLRSRVSELCPPKGAGLIDSGKKGTSGKGRGETIWMLDPSVDEPERLR